MHLWKQTQKLHRIVLDEGIFLFTYLQHEEIFFVNGCKWQLQLHDENNPKPIGVSILSQCLVSCVRLLKFSEQREINCWYWKSVYLATSKGNYLLLSDLSVFLFFYCCEGHYCSWVLSGSSKVSELIHWSYSKRSI